MQLLILFSFVFFLSFDAHAEAQGHIAYCDEADSTAALQDCVNRHHEAAQESLNTVYETLTAKLEGETLEQLRAIQTKWIDYRDQECAWEAGRVETESLKKIYELSCKTRMTENRADLLEATYTNESEEKQAELAGFPRWMNALTEDHPDVFWRFGERERLDLNCDGIEEVVMLGAAVSRIKVLENKDSDMDKDEPGRTPHALDVVVAITENPTVGRPTSQLFRLPITQSLNGPTLCSEKVSLKSSMLEIVDEESEEVAESEKTDTEQKQCPQRIEILAKQCDPVTLLWSGKDYTLDVASKDENDEEIGN